MHPLRRPSSPSRLPGAGLSGWHNAKGISFVGALLIIALAVGLYYLVGKPRRQAEDSATPSDTTPPHVVIYTQPSCEPCEGAKTWLTRHHIAFDERNVDTSFVYKDDLKKLESRIVPVILVNDEPLYGFQAAYLQEALDNARTRRRN